jgi:hypothetical protein
VPKRELLKKPSVEVGAEGDALADAAAEGQLEAAGGDDVARVLVGRGEQGAGEEGGAEADAGADVEAAAVLGALDLDALAADDAGVGDAGGRDVEGGGGGDVERQGLQRGHGGPLYR